MIAVDEREDLTRSKNRLGKYRLLGKLGAGGMAEVFVATADQTRGFNKLLVLKLLRDTLAEEPEKVAMFMDEAKLAARLSHRNVVQTYEVGKFGDRYAIVMEFLEGGALSQLRRSNSEKGLPLNLSLFALCESLAGLHSAHELRDYDGSPLDIVHRDFTPNNLMLTLDGEVKVLDFGIAKTRMSNNKTQEGILKGTVRYMAPEAVFGGAIDRRADLYSAGVVLWELTTGRRMWESRQDVRILHDLTLGKLPKIHEVAPESPQALVDICERALARDPEARFANALEFRTAIRSYMQSANMVADSESLGSYVRSVMGESCAELRRQLDEQLAEQTTSVEVPWVVSGGGEHTGSDSGSELARSGVVAAGNPEAGAAAAPPRVSRLWIALGIGALVVGTLGFVFGRSSNVETGVAARAPVSQKSAALPTSDVGTEPRTGSSEGNGVQAADSAAPARQVEVDVSASPAEAKLFLDGVVLGGNPAVVKVIADRGDHEIRAEAPGFASESAKIRFDADVRVALALRAEVAKRAPGSRASGRKQAQVAPEEPATPTPVPEVVATPPPTPAKGLTRGSPDKRRLDDSDPWAE